MRQDEICTETVIFRLMRMVERTSRELFDRLLACRPMWGGFILSGLLASWLKGQGLESGLGRFHCRAGRALLTSNACIKKVSYTRVLAELS